jgi:hypothetical protein
MEQQNSKQQALRQGYLHHENVGKIRSSNIDVAANGENRAECCEFTEQP